MSILDENIEAKTDKQTILNAFINIEQRYVPFAMKAWIDVVLEYFAKPIPVEDKASILYLLGLCKLNYRIYLRDLGYEMPIITCVEPWKNPKRNSDYIDSWIQYTLSNPYLQTSEIIYFLIGLIGMDSMAETNRWTVDCYIWDHNLQGFDMSYTEPVESKYHQYKQYIYQLLEIYGIKKESE